MSRSWLWPVCLAGWLVPSQAGVFDTDAQGRLRRWDLVDPDSHVGPGVAIPVSTNVVNPRTRAIRYFLGADGWSSTNTTAELNAIRASFAVWQSVPNTRVKFEEGGLVPRGVDLDELDGTNVVFWARQRLVAGGTVDLGTATAVTFYATINKVMIGADLVLNGATSGGFSWFTSTENPTLASRYYLVEAIVTHELGHLLGLEHSPAGGATMFYRDFGGVGPYVGLSADEENSILYLYPAAGWAAARGTISGRVTLGGAGILGAVVVAEDTAGNLAAVTLSKANGDYLMPGLPPGSYQVRACPLDPRLIVGAFLARGQDIVDPDYTGAETSFLPTGNTAVAVVAGGTRSFDIAVTGGTAALRIRGLHPPGPTLKPAFPQNSTASLVPGQSNLIVGVYATETLAGASLRITGEGVSFQPLGTTSNAGYNLLYGSVSVAADATPGLRSIVVTRNTAVAYANGFFEVRPVQPDDNHDGLDDRFQRHYFALWTAPEAGPNADPDHDGFRNQYEYWAGSDPTRASSLPEIELDGITLTTQGTFVSWRSVPGGQYRIERRSQFIPGDPWKTIGSITATGTHTEYHDSTATGRVLFYRVLALP